jgi:hypothetical protein
MGLGTESFEHKPVCKYHLGPRDVLKFHQAIDHDYYFEFIYGLNRSHKTLVAVLRLLRERAVNGC